MKTLYGKLIPQLGIIEHDISLIGESYKLKQKLDCLKCMLNDTHWFQWIKKRKIRNNIATIETRLRQIDWELKP